MRRIKHQPSPLGLRLHPSIPPLPLPRASRCVPSRRSSPLPGREDGEGFPALGTWPRLPASSPATQHVPAMCHHPHLRSQHFMGFQSSPDTPDPRATHRQQGCSYVCEGEPSPRPMQLVASGGHVPGAPHQLQHPPEQAGPNSPCSRRNSLLSILLFPSKTGGKRGLWGLPGQRHGHGKPFGWVSRWCSDTAKHWIFIPIWNWSSRKGTWPQRSLKNETETQSVSLLEPHSALPKHHPSTQTPAKPTLRKRLQRKRHASPQNRSQHAFSGNSVFPSLQTKKPNSEN